MAGAYDRGDLVRFTATFTATDGTFADPGQTWFLLIDGGGGRATHRYGLTPSAIFKATTGCYWIEIDMATSGNWAYRWEATGNGLQAAEETNFSVRPTFKL